MKLIGSKILVKESIKSQQLTKAGLVVPENAAKKYRSGEVVEVGDGFDDEPMKVAKGDNIIFGEYGGTKIKIGTEEYIVIEQKDVLVIL